MNQTIMTMLTQEDFKALVRESIKEEISVYFSAEKSSRPAYDMMTMKELCDQLKVSKPTIITWTRKGILKAQRIGRRVFYKKEEVEKSFKDYRGSLAQEMQVLNALKNWRDNG